MVLIKRGPGGGSVVGEVIHHHPLCVSTLIKFVQQQQQSESYCDQLNVQGVEILAWGPTTLGTPVGPLRNASSKSNWPIAWQRLGTLQSGWSDGWSWWGPEWGGDQRGSKWLWWHGCRSWKFRSESLQRMGQDQVPSEFAPFFLLLYCHFQIKTQCISPQTRALYSWAQSSIYPSIPPSILRPLPVHMVFELAHFPACCKWQKGHSATKDLVLETLLNPRQ